MDELKAQIERGFALYGTIDKWPYFALGPRDVPRCRCGHRRSDHVFQSDQLCACTKCGKCETFNASKPPK
jgi:hypothetical protein